MEGFSKPDYPPPVPSWLRSKPTGVLRLAFRLPVYLYRLDFGWMLGHRFLFFAHKGRKSNLLRETVLEVILYNRTEKESIVLSGRGEKADWYRNIEANPALEVRTGHERYVPEQRFPAPEENHAIISEYARLHPLVFRFLVRVFLSDYPLGGPEDERQRFAQSLRLVAFRPDKHSG